MTALISFISKLKKLMSFFAKGDFKTREEWLKKQKRDIMKK